MNIKCKRCGKEGGYGGYCVDEGKDLCIVCHAEYIRIKNNYHREITRFWDEKTA